MIAVFFPPAIASRTSGHVRSSIQTERVWAVAEVSIAIVTAVSVATRKYSLFTGASWAVNESRSQHTFRNLDPQESSVRRAAQGLGRVKTRPRLGAVERSSRRVTNCCNKHSRGGPNSVA